MTPIKYPAKSITTTKRPSKNQVRLTSWAKLMGFTSWNNRMISPRAVWNRTKEWSATWACLGRPKASQTSLNFFSSMSGFKTRPKTKESSSSRSNRCPRSTTRSPKTGSRGDRYTMGPWQLDCRRTSTNSSPTSNFNSWRRPFPVKICDTKLPPSHCLPSPHF